MLFVCTGPIPALITAISNRVLEHEVFQGRTELLFVDPAVVACMMHQCDGEMGRANCSGWGLAIRTCMEGIPHTGELVDLGCSHTVQGQQQGS